MPTETATLPPTLPTRPGRGRRALAWILGIPLGLLSLILLLGLFGQLALEELPVNAADRIALPTHAHLARHLGEAAGSLGDEKFSKVRSVDGSVELTYEHTPHPTGGGCYINAKLSVDKDPDRADIKFRGYDVGFELGLRADGGGVVARKHSGLYRWGDRSKTSLLELQGVTVGFVFIARRGNRTFFLACSGPPAAYPEGIEPIVKPFLEGLPAYDPQLDEE